VDPLLLAGRVITGLGFVILGVINVGSLAPLTELMRGRRLPFPAVAAVFGVSAQTGLGALLAFGVWPLPASLGLAVFVVMATAIAHWPFTGTETERKANAIACLVNTILLGGLLTQAALALPS
jgi:uncharacterized membrane protein YphA (DoxX/SURF4 family)